MIKSGAGPIVKDNQEVTLIQIERTKPNRNSKGTTWAQPLGENLYEIRGPLHLIVGLSFGERGSC